MAAIDSIHSSVSCGSLGLDGYLTDPTNLDTDGDGLGDYQEWLIFGTDPTTNDTDSDNVTDDMHLGLDKHLLKQVYHILVHYIEYQMFYLKYVLLDTG